MNFLDSNMLGFYYEGNLVGEQSAILDSLPNSTEYSLLLESRF